MHKINAIKGMNDILPVNSYIWLWLEEQLRQWLNCYGYENIRTPIIEDTSLFIRSIGEVTDIVEKEMYTFVDSLNGDILTLRPEGTAGVLRAVTQHNLLYNGTQKLWYIGNMFRHERPQKGRYRQFNQLGIEALGFKGPDIDCEIILMQQDLWQRLGLNNLELQINCLGNKLERNNYRKELIKYLEANIDILDDESKHRLYKNPLRILDTKNPQMQDMVNKAPKLIEYLDNESLSHHNAWKDSLTSLGIKFVENHRLVRGLDYYNLSVFEWVSSNIGTQGTVAAGGRYDSLVVKLSGKENYAIGFAIGMERIILELEVLCKIPKRDYPDVFIANLGVGTPEFAFKVAILLRSINLNVIQNFGENSFKSQLKYANSLNVKFTLIIGETETKNNQVMVKYMGNHRQELVDLNLLTKHMQNILNIA